MLKRLFVEAFGMHHGLIKMHRKLGRIRQSQSCAELVSHRPDKVVVWVTQNLLFGLFNSNKVATHLTADPACRCLQASALDCLLVCNSQRRQLLREQSGVRFQLVCVYPSRTPCSIMSLLPTAKRVEAASAESAFPLPCSLAIEGAR